MLRDGRTDLRDRPWRERRTALERVFAKTGSSLLRISDVVRGDARALYKDALERGWEGLIAKHQDSLYKSGKRTPDWRKLKIVHEQEFVIGGWTEPRQTRTYFGALLLGVYDGDELVYVGHTGTGFNERELAPRDEAAEAARNEDLSVRECPEEQRASTLGAAGAGRADQVHRMDRGCKAPASGLPRPSGRQETDRCPP